MNHNGIIIPVNRCFYDSFHFFLFEKQCLSKKSVKYACLPTFMVVNSYYPNISFLWELHSSCWLTPPCTALAILCHLGRQDRLHPLHYTIASLHNLVIITWIIQNFVCLQLNHSIYLPNPFPIGRMWLKVNFKTEYSWFEFSFLSLRLVA